MNTKPKGWEKSYEQLCRLLQLGDHPVTCGVLKGSSMACDCSKYHDVIKSIFSQIEQEALKEGARLERERLLKFVEAWPDCFMSDVIYTDKEMIEGLQGIIKHQCSEIINFLKNRDEGNTTG